MWMKSMPHCTFSDFDESIKKNNRERKVVRGDLSATPNYYLAGASFDAAHLDRFLTRVNETEAANNNKNANSSIENELTQQAANQEIMPDEMQNSALKNAGLVAALTNEDEDVVVVQDFQEEPQ